MRDPSYRRLYAALAVVNTTGREAAVAEHFQAGATEQTQQPIETKSVDWNYVFSRDVIVLELNEARIHQGEFGFVGDALRALDEYKRNTDS